MAKEEAKYLTPSGIEIPDSDRKSIEKTTMQKAVVGFFALVGLGFTAFGLRGVARGDIQVTVNQPNTLAE